jgi:TnpA family transposase
VLIAEATNIGLATMSRASGIPVGQLTRVADWYLREDTLRAAITALTALIHYHRNLPLTEAFGTGTTSSSDGVRFGVAASTLNARYLPRAFARRRGITVISHVSDQGTQYWVGVVNCQLREATFVLDGLLYNDAPPIEEHYADTEGYLPTWCSGSAPSWASASPHACAICPTRRCTGPAGTATTVRSTSSSASRCGPT